MSTDQDVEVVSALPPPEGPPMRSLQHPSPPRRRPWARAVPERRLALALGLTVLALFFAWEASRAGVVTYARYASDSDEGIFVVSAQLLLQGYALFRDVFSSQPAFYLSSMAAALRLVGDPVVGSHIYEILFGMATLCGVLWMAWTAYRPLAGALAAALLAVSPGFLLYGHAVIAETPMLGLCTLAVAAAQSYYLGNGRRMAVLAGLLFMAGTEMKLLSSIALPPMALLWLGGARRGYLMGRTMRALALDAALFALCAVAPILVVLAAVAPTEQIRQVFAFHLAASRALPAEPLTNGHHLGGFLVRYDVGLLVVAVTGAAVSLLYARQRFLPLVYASWFLSTLIFLLAYHPLAQHEFLCLLPPLALLGAALLGPWTTGWRSGPRRIGPWRAGNLHLPVVAIRGVSALVASVYLVLLCTRSLPLAGALFEPTPMPRRDALIAWIDRVTRPGDFVVCDDPMVALGARRLLPPGLEDMSLVRTSSGFLTAAGAIATTRRYHPAAIVVSHPRQAAIPPAYVAWVQRHYRRARSPVPDAQVYLRSRGHRR